MSTRAKRVKAPKADPTWAKRAVDSMSDAEVRFWMDRFGLAPPRSLTADERKAVRSEAAKRLGAKR
jgi:hypothetical protein